MCLPAGQGAGAGRDLGRGPREHRLGEDPQPLPQQPKRCAAPIVPAGKRGCGEVAPRRLVSSVGITAVP